jgi:hypothetical protein
MFDLIQIDLIFSQEMTASARTSFLYLPIAANDLFQKMIYVTVSTAARCGLWQKRKKTLRSANQFDVLCFCRVIVLSSLKFSLNCVFD